MMQIIPLAQRARTISLTLGSATAPEAVRLALDRVRRSREIVLAQLTGRLAEVPLGAWIVALLDFSRENGFIKYDPKDPQIMIKSFGRSAVEYQYNPFRDPSNRKANGQKPTVLAGKKPDFLAWETFPDAEHYLIWTSALGHRYGILAQPVPIVPDHLIIASLDHDPHTLTHFDQVLRPEHLADMHELTQQLDPLGYVMGFNGRSAGASVDHFHTQAIPRGYLPVVRWMEQDRLRPGRTFSLEAETQMKFNRGTSGSWLASVIRRGRVAYPAEILWLESLCFEPLLKYKQVILRCLMELDMTFNTLSWQTPAGRLVELFFPRGQEAILGGACKAGYVEMSGMLVIPSRPVFDQIRAPKVGNTALRQAGITPEQFDGLAARVLKELRK